MHGIFRFRRGSFSSRCSDDSNKATTLAMHAPTRFDSRIRDLTERSVY